MKRKKKRKKRKVIMMALVCLIAMNGMGTVTGLVTGINGQRPVFGSSNEGKEMRLRDMDESVYGQPYHGKGEEGKMLARTIESGARLVSIGMDTAAILSEHEGRTVANSDDNDLRHDSRECLDTRIDFGGAIDNKAGKDEVNVHVTNILGNAKNTGNDDKNVHREVMASNDDMSIYRSTTKASNDEQKVYRNIMMKAGNDEQKVDREMKAGKDYTKHIYGNDDSEDFGDKFSLSSDRSMRYSAEHTLSLARIGQGGEVYEMAEYCYDCSLRKVHGEMPDKKVQGVQNNQGGWLGRQSANEQLNRVGNVQVEEVENIDEGSETYWTCDSYRIRVNVMDYDGGGVMECDQMNGSSYSGMEAVGVKARTDVRNTNGVVRTMNDDLHIKSLCKGEDVSDGTAEHADCQRLGLGGVGRGNSQNVSVDRGTMIIRNDLDIEQVKVLSIGARQFYIMSIMYVRSGRSGDISGAENGEVTAIDESCSSYVEQGRVLSVDARLSFGDDAVVEDGSRRGAIIDLNGEVQLGSSDNEQGRVVSIARQSLNDIAKHGTSGGSSDDVQIKLDNVCNDGKVCVDCDSLDCWSSGRADSSSAYPKRGEKGTVGSTYPKMGEKGTVVNDESNVKHGRVLIDTRHSHDDVMVGGRAESLNIVSNCMDDKPKVGVKVEVHICSNIEQRRVLMVARHSHGDAELAGKESVTTLEVREGRIASGDDDNVKTGNVDNVKMGRVFVVSRHSQDYRDDIDVIGGMECSGINGHYAERGNAIRRSTTVVWQYCTR